MATLYEHTPHPHTPSNPNDAHAQEQASGDFNTKLAVWLTKNVGTMQCAYLFLGIGVGSLVGIATNNTVMAALFGSLSSYVLQLVLLPILSVGSNVIGRKQELQADETYQTAMHIFHDAEQLMEHLNAQDAVITDIAKRADAMHADLLDRDDAMAALLAKMLDKQTNTEKTSDSSIIPSSSSTTSESEVHQ